MRLRSILIVWMLVCAVTVAWASASPGGTGYIRITGITEGANGGSGYTDYSRVLGYSQAVTSTGSIGPGGASAGNAKFSLAVIKPVDIASPKEMFAAAKGQHLASAEIILPDPAHPSDSTTWYYIRLYDVLITGVRQNYDPLNELQSSVGATETVDLDYAKIEWIVGSSTKGWNVVQNKGWVQAESTGI